MIDAIAQAEDAKRHSPFLNRAQAAFYVGLAQETRGRVLTPEHVSSALRLRPISSRRRRLLPWRHAGRTPLFAPHE